MLDAALEPSYNLSKNLLLLPWILKWIEDMVNDLTPLSLVNLNLYFISGDRAAISTRLYFTPAQGVSPICSQLPQS